LRSGLDVLIQKYPGVLAEHTGLGLMTGLRCVCSNADVIKAFMQVRLLAVKAGGNSIRLLPPLNISEAEVDEALSLIDQACRTLA